MYSPIDLLAAVPRNHALEAGIVLVFSFMVNVGVTLMRMTGSIATGSHNAARGLATTFVMTKTATNVLELETKTTSTG